MLNQNKHIKHYWVIDNSLISEVCISVLTVVLQPFIKFTFKHQKMLESVILHVSHPY